MRYRNAIPMQTELASIDDWQTAILQYCFDALSRSYENCTGADAAPTLQPSCARVAGTSELCSSGRASVADPVADRKVSDRLRHSVRDWVVSFSSPRGIDARNAESHDRCSRLPKSVGSTVGMAGAATEVSPILDAKAADSDAHADDDPPSPRLCWLSR